MRGDCGSCIWFPLVRGGDCVGIPQVWGDCCFEWLCAYPSFVRLIFVWLCALPLSVEVVIVGERSCVLPIVFTPNPQWRFPVWEVLCVRVSENPSVWRRGRRAVCSNLETYLGVCDWSTFSNSLSYICALIHIAISYTCLCCLCVPILVFNQESFT